MSFSVPTNEGCWICPPSIEHKKIKNWVSVKTCSCKKKPNPNNVCPSEATKEPSLLLILKWGGELTPSGRSQAEELGKVFRCMYPGGQGKLSPLHILSLTTKERSGFETQHGRLASKNVRIDPIFVKQFTSKKIVTLARLSNVVQSSWLVRYF